MTVLSTFHRLPFGGAASTPTPPVPPMSGVVFQPTLTKTLTGAATSIDLTGIDASIKAAYCRVVLINALNALSQGSFKINGTTCVHRRITYQNVGSTIAIDTIGWQMGGGLLGVAQTHLQLWIQADPAGVLSIDYSYEAFAENFTDFVSIGEGKAFLAAAPGAALSSLSIVSNGSSGLNTGSFVQGWSFDAV